jgi:hypothetical protein
MCLFDDLTERSALDWPMRWHCQLKYFAFLYSLL